MIEKSGSTRSTPGWWSSGNSTPQSMTRSRPAYSSTVMLRPISPRPPSATTRSASGSGSGGGRGRGSLPRSARHAASPARSEVLLAARRPRRRSPRPAAGACGGCRARRSSSSAALTMIAPWVRVMIARTAGTSARSIVAGPSQDRRRRPRRSSPRTGGPATWPTTLTVPTAPIASSARVISSAPE